MALLFVNNAKSTLQTNLTAVALTLSLFPGTGSLFPNPTGGDYFKLTLEDSAGNIEIVHCTARSIDTCTIVRAQEGTTAKAFSAGAAVENRFTAGSMAAFNTYSIASLAEATAGISQNTIMTPYTTKYFWDQRVSSFAATILDDVDAAAVRTTLGLGDAATGTIGTTVQAYDANTVKSNITTSYTAQQYAAPVNLGNSSGTVTLNANVHQDVLIPVNGNITFAIPTNAASGKSMFITINGTSTHTITWNSVFKSTADVTLPTACVTGKNIYLQFRCLDASNWVLLGMVTGA